MRNFYNTINLSGDKLAKANAKAMGQEELMKEIFLQNPTLEIAPSQMHKLFNSKFGRHHPITSIRRALTNLSGKQHDYFLIKTGVQIIGEFGLPEHLWAKKNKPQEFIQSANKQQSLF